jgi:hypothetical protein
VILHYSSVKLIRFGYIAWPTTSDLGTSGPSNKKRRLKDSST